MNSSEKKWIWIFATIVIVVTTLPFLAGFWLQGEDWRFTGFFIGVEDGNSYIAKMLIGTSHDWLFRTPYTAYPQNGFFAFFPYLLLGKLVAGSGQHDQLVALFQLFRWASVYAMIFATYQFSTYFIKEIRLRRLSTAIATIGGGLGWLAFIGLQSLWGDRLPLEFYSPETFGFLSLFTLPHLALGRGLLLFGLLAYWKGYSGQQKISKNIINSLLWIGLGLMQPLTVIVGWAVIGLDLAIRFLLHQWGQIREKNWRDGLKNGLVMLAFSFPIVAYTAISFLTDPFLKLWSQQNIILSPPPMDYIFAYGICLPFLYFGIKLLIQQKRIESYALIGWAAFLPVLAYFPNNLQRRFPEGIWVAFVVITLLGLSALPFPWKRIGHVFLYSSFLTTLFLFSGSLLSIFQVKTPIYRPVGEIEAFEFLESTKVEFPVVLAAYDTANALPAWVPVRTLIGHGPESIHLSDIKPQVAKFFQYGTSDGDRLNFIDEFNIRYILWGPEEKRLGSWDPAEIPQLTMVYQNKNYQVFEVNNAR